MAVDLIYDPGAGLTMQIVNILSDDPCQMVSSFKPGEGDVGSIGYGGGNSGHEWSYPFENALRIVPESSK